MVSLFAASRNQGAVFLGWSGDCPDTGNSTTLDMSAARSCTATFDEVRAEVALTLQGTPTPALAGDTFVVDATVNNSGPDVADNVTTLLTPPVGTTVATAQLPPSCTHVLPVNLVECSLGSVAAGSSGVVSVPFDVDPFTRGQIVTDANASSITWDPVLADNSFSLTTTVIVSADLSLIKTASPVSVPRGTLQVYRLEVTNSGPSASGAATVIDTLPGFVSWRVNPTDPAPNLAMGPLAPGLSSVATLLTDIDPAAPIGQSLVNVADVAGADPDPNATNNSDGVTSTVVGPRISGSTTLELVADASTPIIGGSQLVGFHWHPALD
ncbi:MAG: DUF11 domain-containing protein, partial [Thermoanaerobaculia bacterium]|nr:DUF11 domain-containing protein [Thermoanaerobaculia bacterium]